MVRHPQSTSVIAPEAPLPPDLTHRHALFALYALQEWECVPPRPDPYAPGFFYNRIQSTLHGLQHVSRETTLRHLKQATCLACAAPIDLARSRLDHIMSLARGGADALHNALLLCRACNSSKGTKDLLEWWLFKGYAVRDLPRTIVCLYARVYWQDADDTQLQLACPSSTHHFLAERMTGLPTEAHRIALIGATYAGCAFVHWLKERPVHD